MLAFFLCNKARDQLLKISFQSSCTLMSHTGCCNRPWWKSSASVCWSICYPGRTKHNTYHQIHFPGILWHLRWPDLRDLLTRSYSCVHICSSLHVMGVNPFTDSFLTLKKKDVWLVAKSWSDIWSSATEVIALTDSHVQWEGESI